MINDKDYWEKRPVIQKIADAALSSQMGVHASSMWAVRATCREVLERTGYFKGQETVELATLEKILKEIADL